MTQKQKIYHIRRDEHKKDIKSKEKYHNVISRHLSLYHYDESNFINWENIEILHQEHNFYKRLFAEMVFIKKEGNNCLNKITDLEHYNPSYNMLLDYFT